jgi:hypothetical protein
MSESARRSAKAFAESVVYKKFKVHKYKQKPSMGIVRSSEFEEKVSSMLCCQQIAVAELLEQCVNV